MESGCNLRALSASSMGEASVHEQHAKLETVKCSGFSVEAGVIGLAEAEFVTIRAVTIEASRVNIYNHAFLHRCSHCSRTNHICNASEALSSCSSA